MKKINDLEKSSLKISISRNEPMWIGGIMIRAG